MGDRTRKRALATGAVLTLMVVLVLVDCGGGSGGGSSSEEELTPEEAGQRYAECMRDQGIDDFPDPDVEADGSVMFQDLADLAAPDEQIEAADEACRPILEQAPGPRNRESPGGAESETQGERQEIDPAQAGWEQIEPGGDCQCADGSEYSFYARAADPKKVVLFLDGGGACWSAETCAPDGDNEYQTAVDAPNGEGVFDFGDERNPFADHSFVYVPYCTGDVHLGDATTEYAADLTIHHKGYVNGTAALDYLASTFRDATDVVVIGASAGSIAAPVYGGLVADRLPDARVTVVADSSGAYPDVPEVDDILTGDAWGVPLAIDAGQRSFPGLFVQTGRDHPGLVLARYDHAYDDNQASKLAAAGVPADDLVSLIDANEAQIEDAGVNLLSYTAPGDDHVVFDNDSFYDETVEGEALVDWVTKLVHGEPVDDVHCSECGG